MMRSLAQIQKLELADPVQSGPSKLMRLLKADDPAGIIMGVSEFGPGAVDVEVNLDEVLYILDGELKVEGRGGFHLIAAGEALWIPTGDKVVFSAEAICRMIYILVRRPAHS